MNNNFNIWEGVYTSFHDASALACGKGFGGDIYRQRSLKAAKECLQALQENKSIPSFHKQRSNILPSVVAMILSQIGGNLSILDFGGGLGIGYMTLIESLATNKENLSYTIMEVPEVCAIGQELFPEEEVQYTDGFPANDSFSLIHSASALQYVENWKDILKRFAEYKSEFILLSDVFAGNNPSFVTLQNYYDSKIRHWFLNFDELIETLRAVGYELVMKTYVSSRRNGVEDILPMDNFPEEYRLTQSLHLLLKRIK